MFVFKLNDKFSIQINIHILANDRALALTKNHANTTYGKVYFFHHSLKCFIYTFSLLYTAHMYKYNVTTRINKNVHRNTNNINLHQSDDRTRAHFTHRSILFKREREIHTLTRNESSLYDRMMVIAVCQVNIKYKE